MGQDATSDLAAYHFVDAYWAVVDGFRDVVPAGYQGYLNPLGDLPLFVGLKTFSPLLFTFLLGCVQGTAGIALYLVARTCDLARSAAVGSAAAGMLTATALSEYGTTQGDLYFAPLVIGGICLITWTHAATPPRRPARFLASGFLLLGAAAGLKLTTAPIVLGGLVAIAVVAPRGIPRPRATLVAIASTVLGFLATYGWWGVELWSRFGNPVFPLFNEVLHSPYAASDAFDGINRSVHGVWPVLAFPFSMVLHPTSTGPVTFRQLCFPVLEVLLVAVVLVAAVRSIRDRRRVPVFSSTPTRFLSVLFVASYLAWVLTTGIYRYMVSLEMLSIVLIVLLVRELVSKLGVGSLWAVAASVTVIGILASQQTPDWGRVSFRSQYFDVAIPHELRASPTNFILIDDDVDTAYVIASFPGADVFVRSGTAFPLTPAMAALGRRELSSRTPTYVLYGSPTENGDVPWVVGTDLAGRLRVLGFRLAASTTCRLFVASFDGEQTIMHFCRATPLRQRRG